MNVAMTQAQSFGRRMLLGILCLASILGWSQAHGQSLEIPARTPVIALAQGEIPGVNLSPGLQYFKDSSGSLTLAELSSPSFDKFEWVKGDRQNVGIFQGHLWLKLRLIQAHSESQKFLLDLKTPARRIELYLRRSGELDFQKSEAGLGRIEDGLFQLRSRSNTWELELARGQELEAYILVESDHTFIIELRAFDLHSFYLAERGSQSFAGLYLGVMLLLVCFNFVLAIQTREISYAYYVLVLLTYHIPVIGVNLFGNEFFGYRLSFAEGRYFILLKMLGTIFMGLFSQSILLSQSNRRLSRAFSAVIGLLCLFVPGWFFYRPLSQWHVWFNSCVLIYLLLIVGTIVRQLYKGYRPAILFGISVMPTIGLGVLGIILEAFKLSHLLNNFHMLLTSTVIFQAIILSFAITNKMYYLQKQKELADAAHAKEIMDLNASLEIKVADQTREIRSMLENTHLGLLSIKSDFTIHKDYSRHLETLLECHDLADSSVWEVFLSKAQLSHEEAARLRCALEYSLGDELMFFDANVPIMPTQVDFLLPSGRIRTFDLDWSAVANEEQRVERILVGITDATERLQFEKKAEENRIRLQSLAELLQIGEHKFRKIARDLNPALQLYRLWLSQRVDDTRELFIQLHTLKSRTRMEGFVSLASVLHDLEESLALKTQVKQLRSEGEKALEKTETLLEHYEKALLSLQDFKTASGNVEETHAEELSALIKSFETMIKELAKELGKADCLLVADIRETHPLSKELHDALEGALLHIVRNTLDHGIETKEERLAVHKPPVAQIHMRQISEGHLSIQDDGRGLNLKRIAEKAQKLGLSYNNTSELANLVFVSGFSTKESVTQISGRGVGMDAVKAMLRAQGGDAWIELLGEPSDDSFISFAIVLTWAKTPSALAS